MKKYHVKNSILMRLQGIMLLLLAYAAYKTGSGEAAIIFALMGIVLLLQNVHIFSHFAYKISKRIYRKYRWTETLNK